jgi:hypothetical protein
MHVRRLIAATLLLIGLAACSSLPPPVGITLNAAPGRFSEVQANVKVPPGGSDTTNLVMRFVKLQPSGEWNSAFTTCIQGDDATHDVVCLQLAVRDGKVVPARVVNSNVGELIPEREILPGTYEVQNDFLLHVETDQQNARFSLNGVQLFEFETVKHPKRISFICSSAVCAVDVRP